MLLQTVQLQLQAMIVIDHAYPDANTFNTAMESEFEEQVDACLESGGTIPNQSRAQYNVNGM